MKVDPSFALEIQHLAPQLIERINSFFGYRAVGNLTLRQAPLPARKAAAVKTQRNLSPDAEARLKRQLDSVEDPDLRLALERLGRNFAGQRDE